MHSFPFSIRRLAPLAALWFSLAAVAPAQRLYAWGDNGVGQLNVPLAAQSGAKKVRAGYYFSLALMGDGSVVAWGDNSYGECNVPATALSGVSVIGAGVLHGLAIKNGQVIAWGSNERGETTVPASALSGVTGVAGGEYFSLALKNGGVLGWGSNDYGVMSIPGSAQSGVTAIACGSYHALAVKNGGVIAWGMNVAGSTDVPVGAQSGVVTVAAGYLHTLALKSDGSVVAWGWNNMGQCNVPVAAQSDVVSIAAGYDFSVAVKSDGSIVMWGDNDYGWLNYPADVTPVVGVSTSAYHTLAIKAAAWATIDLSSVAAGSSAQGTVHLSSPAAAGGVTVNLVSDNGTVHVPASVTVSAGNTDAPFTVTTDEGFGADINATVCTSYNGTDTVAAKLKVTSSPVFLTFNKASIVGGSLVKATATLSISTPMTADHTFALASSDSAHLAAPGSATIPAGRTSVLVPLTHNALSGSLQQSVAITASVSGFDIVSAPMTIEAFKATVTFESNPVKSGESTYGFVTLNVPPRDSIQVHPAVADGRVTVPSSITVNAGARTAFFPISTVGSVSGFVCPVQAVVNSNTFASNLTVLAFPSVKSLTLASSMWGLTKISGSLQLTVPARAGGQVVNLSATGGLTVPASVTVPEGLSTATFDLVAPDVLVLSTASLTASTSLSSVTKSLSIKPLLLMTISLSAPSVLTGGTFNGTVTLGAAPSVDVQVQLESNSPLVTLPATITVLAGTTSASFTCQAGTTSGSKTVRITASRNGKSLSKSIIVHAP